MPLIRQLPVSMINKIAAGEVIERPASVVKELVENSIDAGATRIDVSVDRGGIESIRIVDNGCGIEADQLVLAMSSHATSKIAETEDLFRIRTFGFRGEALASIAEISQMTIRSRTPEHHEGAEIRSEGGVFSPVAPCGHPVGTSIEIRNLFFNTPVRRKYLRSNQTELGHVTETFLRLAIPHPDVHFTLKHNDRMMYDLPPTSDGIDRIAKLFGKEVADDLIAVESRRGEVGVSGYVAHPNQSRSNNRLQYFFLNRRHIRDRALQHALTEAYRGLLTVGRFPIAFLHVEIPPDQVDVNVHPTKMEVRFLDSNKVYGHFLGAIRERFLSADLKSRPTLERHSNDQSLQSFGQASGKPVAQISQRFVAENNAGNSNDEDSPFGNNEFGNNEFGGNEFGGNEFGNNDPRTAMADQTAEQLRQQVLDWAKNIKATDTETGDNAPGSESRKNEFRLSRFAGMTGTGQKSDPASVDHTCEGDKPASRLQLQLHELNNELLAVSPNDDSHPSITSRPAFRHAEAADNGDVPTPVFPKMIQIHRRYIVTETEDGLAIIDQHAAHERVLYEKLKLRMTQGTIESQRLLVPKPVDLPPNESACVLENRSLLARLGLIVEPFGGDTILISGYPAVFQDCDPVEILQSLLEPLMVAGRKPDRNDLLDEMMHQMSCKAAVKAGDKLRPEAMAELLQLARDEINAHHCPHGRPSTLIFTCTQLDKMFKRV
ncbi:MAG: DNA mismatch repair endonuclease MutL [Planctomycetaceae bacterium]|nr:DNA mismatch repair endonuclease MutL [Planctomycetaceae bacterium]